MEALNSPVSYMSFNKVLENHKHKLKKEMVLDYPEQPPEEQLEAARKNVTQSYIQILRFALKLMENMRAHQACVDGVREDLSQKLSTIDTVIGIYRDPTFKPYVDFLKENILTEQRLPALVMALDVKPADKIIMMTMMPGFLYALHHPEENYGSWDLEVHRAAGNTLHIIRAIKEEGVGYDQAMKMLEDAYKEIATKPIDSKYNNISGRYRTIVRKALT